MDGYEFEYQCAKIPRFPPVCICHMQDGYNYRYVKRIPLCNITKKTLKNCISTILQGRFLRLDTLGLIGYFTSLEDI